MKNIVDHCQNSDLSEEIKVAVAILPALNNISLKWLIYRQQQYRDCVAGAGKIKNMFIVLA